MKTTVNNYMYSTFNERGTKAFEKKVAKILKDNCINGDVICRNAWKEKLSGYGQYSDVIEIEVNGKSYFLKTKNNDSQAWDIWEDTTKEKRDLFLAVLERHINYLHDEIKENYEE